MKRIFTLLTLLVSVLSGFSQAGTTYRWKPATTTINGTNFLLAANWNIVSPVDGSLTASGVSPTAGATLQILSNLTVTTNDIDLRTAGAFTLTVGGGYSANTTLTLSNNLDIRLANGSTINLQSRLAGGIGVCRSATITMGTNTEIRIYNPLPATTHVKKAENSVGGSQSLTANCTSGTSTYVAASGANPGGIDANENFLGFLAQAGGPTLLLPLQLKDFSAQKGSGKVTLNWSTVLEINTSHFEVEQSNNGTTWKSIAVVPANGNSNSVQNYSADDNATYSSKVYYRLKMVDADGKFEYSPIAVVTFGGKGRLMAYPNPASSFTMISSDKAITENVTVSIFNTTGVLVQQQVISKPGNNFRVGLENLKQGSYLLKINSGNELIEVIKIQKN